jgi:hypothetical protein
MGKYRSSVWTEYIHLFFKIKVFSAISVVNWLLQGSAFANMAFPDFQGSAAVVPILPRFRFCGMGLR